MKPGALAAAQHANAVVIARRSSFSAWWIESWDRSAARPFARWNQVQRAVRGGSRKEALRRGMTTAERALRAVTYGADR